MRDLTGRLRAWIDVGTPSAERLHRAGKAAARVVVYVHKDYRQWLRQLEGAVIHRRESLLIHTLDPAFVAALVARLERRMSFALSVAEGEVFVAFADATIAGRVKRMPLTDGAR